ncbi:protein Shroom2-like isoform X2 [Phycodurus eques]|uniref:protein Shroom2-like isoform X2 n=1 Tax=Phycodurus eques TaxID=693459 RepID=UPI002ACD31DC|nr:protein Shroom2-like isoform X2 [Phycodurus eques]
MVDVVSPHTMPSESEVLVARCFLTKILQSSMRKNRFKGKNDQSSRPHSWHSSKLTEEGSEPLGRETTPVSVWQQKEARLKESPCQKDHNNQHLLTGHLNSMSHMEKLGHPAPPFPPHRGSLTKYTSSSEPPSGTESKRDTFSCFSSGSNTLVLDSSSLGRKGTRMENIFFKGVQDEGPFTVAHPEYLQTPCQEGLWLDEQNSSWMSSRFRPSVGSVWKVPEKKKPKSPPPPLRHNDSCVATRVFPYSERSEKNPNTHRRSVEKLTEGKISHPEKNTKSSYSVTSLSDKDFLHPSRVGEHNELHPNKHFSLSSNDVRQSQYTNRPYHPKQYSDESPLYLQTSLAPHIQSVGSYYRSLQDLPMKASSGKLVCCSSASRAPTNLENDTYTGPVNKKGNHQMAHTENIGHNGLLKNVLLLDAQSSECSHYRDPEEATEKNERHTNKQRIFPAHQSSNHKIGLSRLHDPWVPQEHHRISPLETPMLHSLTNESRIQMGVKPTSIVSSQNVCDSMVASVGKSSRRGDRYATTLRNEVQQKRAQLQKSCSAATLTCDVQEEDPAEWKYAEPSSSCSISSSNTYKDNLKEVQARVLQATSFQRRDLEPLGAEAPVLKNSNERIRGRKHFPLAKRMHSFSEPDMIDLVGVDREDQEKAFDQMTFFEPKPAFSKPCRPDSTSNTDLNPSGGKEIQTKVRSMSEEAQETYRSVETNCLSPPGEEVLLEQQKLGTFAEYQATWNKQKRTSEAKIQGRYYSAENILETEAEEKAVSFHERSRSSPSADFCTQNIPSLWRDPQKKQSNDPARNDSPVSSFTDQQPGPDAVNPTFAVSSGPCSLGPLLGFQLPAQPLQANAVSPSRPHLGPETTCLSQDFLSAKLANPVMVHPPSSLDTTTKGPTPPGSPRRMPQSDRSTGDVESKKEQIASSFSSSHLAMKLPHSPSPHSHASRLMDKQLALSMQEDSPLWSENDSKLSKTVMNVNRSGRKVLGVVPTNPSQSCNTSGIMKPSADIISVDASEMWPSSVFNVCRQQPTKDLGPESQQFRVKDSISESNLTGQGDAKTEQLVRDILVKDKSLMEILHQSGRKTTMDLMEGLFLQEKQILEGVQQRRRPSSGSKLPSTSRRDEEDVSPADSLVPSSSYYNTSAPKAELLIKMKDMQEQLLEQDSEDEVDVDLASKKELISSLAKKLEVLREARRSLQEDVEDNEALGSEVETTVQRFCLANQLDKFRMFVGDLDKVVSLLLSLSGRLARVENALNGLEDGAPPEEKRTLTEKRKLLMQQYEDAKELKDNLDRRERLVSTIMEAHLDPERLDDYRHFVKMKSALIIEQRKLEDKINLGEEQLKCLLDSLPLQQRSQF